MDEQETNEKGGRQSKVSGRFDRIDVGALKRLAAVCKYGDGKYGPNNWRVIPLEDHLNHALEHIYNYLGILNRSSNGEVIYTKDGKMDELGHAFCRVMFALAVEMQDQDFWDKKLAKEVKCPRCGGSGKIPDDDMAHTPGEIELNRIYRPCPLCEKKREIDSDVHREWIDCPKCGTAGCPVCEGRGRVLKPAQNKKD